VRFFEGNEIREWCAERGIALEDDARPAAAPRLTHTARSRYARGGRSGREAAVAAAAVRALGPWDEALLWVTQVGVWPSTEDWPAYYAMRGARGERRSIDVAPGHYFAAGQDVDLIDFLRVVLESGWDAYLLGARDQREIDTRAYVSHDEWVEFHSAAPVEFSVAAV
jgi:hypothetical protein